MITYDQRGHGRSRLGNAPMVNEHLGQHVSAVLEHTAAGGKPAVVVGHSMGGMSVMSWAVQHPSEVGRTREKVGRSLERFEIWRDATHLLNWEQPHRFNAVIADLSVAGPLR